MKYLVETALLGHGIVSVTNQEILNIFPKTTSLAWIDHGEIKIGNINEFLKIRDKASIMGRFDGETIKDIDKNSNGFLTASGTMYVAEKNNIPLVISCGLGGIGDIKDEKLCVDLPFITDSKVVLLGTAIKDMLDTDKTFKYLFDRDVKVMSIGKDYYDGYIFNLEKYKLSGEILLDKNISISEIYNNNIKLILNPIDNNKRIENIDILNNGILAGKKAELEGNFYHPAVNEYFDRSTNGLSSKIQLEALVDNILMVDKNMKSSYSILSIKTMQLL